MHAHETKERERNIQREMKRNHKTDERKSNIETQSFPFVVTLQT